MTVLFVFIRFIRAVWRGLKEPEFRGLFVWVGIILAAGTWFYRSAEGWSWLDSFYFTVITLTTVGYGDLSPQTAVGKIFTIVYIIVGLGIISSFILLMAEHQRAQRPDLLQKLRDRTQKEDDNAQNSRE